MRDDYLSKSRKLELITQLKNSSAAPPPRGAGTTPPRGGGVGMNTKRENFYMLCSHTIRITPYWLLDIIEGESLLFLNDPKNMVFILALLLLIRYPLINAIKYYIDNYNIYDLYLVGLKYVHNYIVV